LQEDEIGGIPPIHQVVGGVTPLTVEAFITEEPSNRRLWWTLILLMPCLTVGGAVELYYEGTDALASSILGVLGILLGLLGTICALLGTRDI
jgi:protein-S-isoprenylcysteine O-methyltransferase Ste14